MDEWINCSFGDEDNIIKRELGKFPVEKDFYIKVGEEFAPPSSSIFIEADGDPNFYRKCGMYSFIRANIVACIAASTHKRVFSFRVGGKCGN